MFRYHFKTMLSEINIALFFVLVLVFILVPLLYLVATLPGELVIVRVEVRSMLATKDGKGFIVEVVTEDKDMMIVYADETTFGLLGVGDEISLNIVTGRLFHQPVSGTLVPIP